MCNSFIWNSMNFHNIVGLGHDKDISSKTFDNCNLQVVLQTQFMFLLPMD